ncbi:MAG: methyltransferase domain-containing protein [Acidimicrobiales bacterium]
MPTDERDRTLEYGEAYEQDYGYERHQVGARRRLLTELVRTSSPNVVVETGCGSELLADAVVAAGLSVEQWIVVEPFPRFAEAARLAAERLPFLSVVEGLAEEVGDEVLAKAVSPPDLVICSSLLHEVADTDALLQACRRLIAEREGMLHVNIPNARSLHRRLARAAGLIADEAEMTSRNLVLRQQRVLDMAGLTALVTSAGLSVEESGGYMLKPFTHAQMEQLEFLTPELLAGLYTLGRELPELASEIFVNARAAK